MKPVVPLPRQPSWLQSLSVKVNYLTQCATLTCNHCSILLCLLGQWLTTVQDLAHRHLLFFHGSFRKITLEYAPPV